MVNSLTTTTEESSPDYSTWAIEDLIRDKVWKARVYGYGRLTKVLLSSSAEAIRNYADLMQLVPIDSNAAALDAGLAPLMLWIQASPMDSFCKSTRRGLISPLVERGLGSSRSTTKGQSLNCLIEIAVKDGAACVMVSFVSCIFT